MPRMRTLKPEFATSNTIAEMPKLLRLHFALMWTYVDDEGRGLDNPRLIKGAIWPLDDDVTVERIDGWQEELVCHGRLIRYVVDGKELFQVVNFTEHQRPNRRVPSRLPAPVGGSQRPHHCVRSEGSLLTHCRLTPVVVVVDVVVDVDVEATAGRCTAEKPVPPETVHAALSAARTRLNGGVGHE